MLLAATCLAGNAGAAVITYEATQLDASTWRYDYIIANDGAITAEIRLLDILFDPLLYAEPSLVIVSHPDVASAWGESMLSSGLDVPAAYDVLAPGDGIDTGESATGFAVSFTWLGEGAPGPQPVEIYDPASFARLGITTTTPVPAPATAPLLGAGLLAAGARLRRRRRG
jgi:hypothetical protein